MNRILSAGLLLTLAFSSGCKESPPAGPATSEAPGVEESSATAPCPAGEAVVHRGETTLQVPVAEAFANAQDNDRIQLGAGRALTHATYKLKDVRGVHITGNGTTLVAKSDIPVMNFDNCVGVTLDGVHVVHEIGEWCAHACVEVTDGSDITITNCDLDGSGYWGIGMWDVQGARILDNLFHNCHDGFAAYRSGGIELRGNTFKKNRNKDIEAAEHMFVNDHLDDNVFTSD